jgi:flagellar basal body-associated protein FliL
VELHGRRLGVGGTRLMRVRRLLIIALAVVIVLALVPTLLLLLVHGSGSGGNHRPVQTTVLTT